MNRKIVVDHDKRIPIPNIKTPFRFLEAICRDLIAIPGLFMSKKKNAKLHLKFVCKGCSKWRKSFRDPKQEGSSCMWHEAWSNEQWDIPRSFGLKSWLKYYFGIKNSNSLKQLEKKIKKSKIY